MPSTIASYQADLLGFAQLTKRHRWSSCSTTCRGYPGAQSGASPRAQDKTPEFRPLLSLHPFWIFRRCDTCVGDEAFVFNERGYLYLTKDGGAHWTDLGQP